MRFNEFYFIDDTQLNEAPKGADWVGNKDAGATLAPLGRGIKNIFKSLGIGKKFERLNIESLKYKSQVSPNIYKNFIEAVRLGLDPKQKTAKFYIKGVYSGKPTPIKYKEDKIKTVNDFVVYKTNHGGRIASLSYINDKNTTVYVLGADEKANDWFRTSLGVPFNTFITVEKIGARDYSNGSSSIEDVRIGSYIEYKLGLQGKRTEMGYCYNIEKNTDGNIASFQVVKRKEDINIPKKAITGIATVQVKDFVRVVNTTPIDKNDEKDGGKDASVKDVEVGDLVTFNFDPPRDYYVFKIETKGKKKLFYVTNKPEDRKNPNAEAITDEPIESDLFMKIHTKGKYIEKVQQAKTPVVNKADAKSKILDKSGKPIVEPKGEPAKEVQQNKTEMKNITGGYLKFSQDDALYVMNSFWNKKKFEQMYELKENITTQDQDGNQFKGNRYSFKFDKKTYPAVEVFAGVGKNEVGFIYFPNKEIYDKLLEKGFLQGTILKQTDNTKPFKSYKELKINWS